MILNSRTSAEDLNIVFNINVNGEEFVIITTSGELKCFGWSGGTCDQEVSWERVDGGQETEILKEKDKQDNEEQCTDKSQEEIKQQNTEDNTDLITEDVGFTVVRSKRKSKAEPLVGGGRLDIRDISAGLTHTLLSQDFTTLRRLVDAAGPDFKDTRAVARELGL
ncbi:uncharacterized protein LOC125139265 [Tachysurus ichikawai]